MMKRSPKILLFTLTLVLLGGCTRPVRQAPGAEVHDDLHGVTVSQSVFIQAPRIQQKYI